MAEIFNKIDFSYDKPSPNEMENLIVLEDRFNKVKTYFDKLKSKADVKTIEMKSFEDFLND